METNDLKQTLSKLHLHLEANQPLDAELRDLLQVLDRDIHQLLAQEAPQAVEWSPAAEADIGDMADTLAERTQGISAQFAARHRRLEPVLRELGAILERMGI